jgi:hypothetical protein
MPDSTTLKEKKEGIREIIKKVRNYTMINAVVDRKILCREL